MFLQYVRKRCPPTISDTDILTFFPLFLEPGSPAASWFATNAATTTTLSTLEAMGMDFVREFPPPTANEIRSLIAALRIGPELRPLNLLSKVVALQQQAPKLVSATDVFNIILRTLPPPLREKLETDPSYNLWVDNSTDLSINGGLGRMLYRAQELLVVRAELAVYPVEPPIPVRPSSVHLITDPAPPEQKDHAPAIMGLQQAVQSLADRVERGTPLPLPAPPRRDDRDSRARDPGFPPSDRDFQRPDRDFQRQDRDFQRPDRDFQRPDRDFQRQDRDFQRQDRDLPRRDPPDQRYQRSDFPGSRPPISSDRRSFERSDPRTYPPPRDFSNPSRSQYRERSPYDSRDRERFPRDPRDRISGDMRRPTFSQSRIAALGSTPGDFYDDNDDGDYYDDDDDYPDRYFNGPPHGPPDGDAFSRP
jgi:hypothetical protein